MERLRVVAAGAGRDPGGVRLVAITKGFGIGVVRAAVEAGLTALGENRVQEAANKVAAFPALDWHLVGRLQSNKARAAVRLFSTIHSVDSLELLQRLDRIAADEGRRPRLLLQVNVAGDERKAGFDPAWFAAESAQTGAVAEALAGLGAAEVVGLMTIGPLDASDAEQRAAFATLRDLRDGLRRSTGAPLPELSMGMSADAEAAVAEGSTMVRIGTAIFGPRPHH